MQRARATPARTIAGARFATLFPRYAFKIPKPSIQFRGFAQNPGGNGGFPGLSFMQQPEKGEALKQYVRLLFHPC